MIVNFSTLLALLACLLLPLLRPQAALLVVAAASFFGTYAFGTEEGVKILPGLFVATAYCVWLAIQGLYAGKLRVPQYRGYLWHWGLLIYAALVTVGAPVVFGGSVTVIRPGAVNEGIRWTVPLEFTSSSIAQLGYLFIASILMFRALTLARRKGFRIESSVDFHFALTAVLSVLVCIEAILGLAGSQADLFSWFMGDTFGDPREDRYALAGVFGVTIRRAQTVFGEPSYFSAYMMGVWGAVLLQARVRTTARTLLCLFLTLAGLILAFSTTATVGAVLIAIMALCVPLREAHGGVRVRRPGARWRRWLIATVIVAIVGTALWLVLSSETIFNYLFGKLMDTSGYEEGNYSSGAERIYWDTIALRGLVDSYGVGIGAGATRGSSFLLTFAAAFGVPGIIVMVGLILRLLRALFSRKVGAAPPNVKVALMMFMGWLIGFAMSVPDGMSFFYAWIELGFLLALLATPQARSALESPSALGHSPA